MTERGDREQLIERILALEERLFRVVGPCEQWLGVDFTMSQLKIMLLLFTDGPTRMGVLASSLGVSLATASGIVERLVKQGFVLRANQPGDRRVVVCKLSQKGQEVMDNLWQSRQVWAKSFLKRMAAEKLQIIAEALETILTATTAAKEDSQSLIHSR